jgi:transcriptional regulator with PAS, ATPase and Fis domain
LNVLIIRIPPLRERLDDLVPLVDYFLQRFNEKMQKNIVLTEKARRVLRQYAWPGNIRELEHLIERVVTLSEDAVVDEGQIRTMWAQEHSPQYGVHGMKEHISVEKIKELLTQTYGNKAAVARLLSISRQNLNYYIRKFKIT